jgi:CRP/FNR family transcriptional regulator, anaerobic regulatory protein
MTNPLTTFLGLFRDISHDRQLIADITEHRMYKEGDVLLKEGSVAKELFFIVSGVLKITSVNDKGIDVTYFFVKENQFCTILKSFTSGNIAGESIVAACNTEVLAISKTKLEGIYTQLPYMKELIGQIMQQRLLDKIDTRNAYLGNDAAARYQLFLMREPDIALRVALADVASYLGITPQSLSRIRKNSY